MNTGVDHTAALLALLDWREEVEVVNVLRRVVGG
jgi:hypothetical protein